MASPRARTAQATVTAIVAGIASALVSISDSLDIASEELVDVGAGLMLSAVASVGLVGLANSYRKQINQTVDAFVPIDQRGD